MNIHANQLQALMDTNRSLKQEIMCHVDAGFAPANAHPAHLSPLSSLSTEPPKEDSADETELTMNADLSKRSQKRAAWTSQCVKITMCKK